MIKKEDTKKDGEVGRTGGQREKKDGEKKIGRCKETTKNEGRKENNAVMIGGEKAR